MASHEDQPCLGLAQLSWAALVATISSSCAQAGDAPLPLLGDARRDAGMGMGASPQYDGTTRWFVSPTLTLGFVSDAYG